MKDAPLVIIFFDRPDCLSKLWSVVEVVKPSTLIALADGAGTVNEQRLVKICREIVKPTWNCKFIPIYQDQHVGLRRNIVDGLNAVFEDFTEAIVLEDDCIPHPSFFSYCNQLLEIYETDDTIFSITGINQFVRSAAVKDDFSFSRYFSTWGWATWKRSWQSCNWGSIPVWSAELEDVLQNRGVLKNTWQHWRRILQNEEKCKNSWGYQCAITALVKEQLTIFPKINSIRNVGLNSGAHFKNRIVNWRFPEVGKIPDTLSVPLHISPDNNYDELFEKRHFDPVFLRRVMRKMFLG